MDFLYFNSKMIFQENELKGQGQYSECIPTYEEIGFSHRWIQPPVACYFVTSLDENGNENLAPISMGTAMWGEAPGGNWYYGFAVHNSRQTCKNLKAVPECVLSYYPATLLRQSWLAALPLPHGISELEVAGLTPLPSKQVQPNGVQECVSNLEIKIIHTYEISHSTVFIGEVVGCSVQKELFERDMRTPYEPGLVMTDLLYEVSINGSPTRLNYTRMNLDHIYPCPDDIGDTQWIGTYQSWLQTEKERGRITEDELNALLALNAAWSKNRDPIQNANVKAELTAMLKDICARPV